ncbi:unnamed protein product [Lactuca saligna]|uniref:Uncharacterized protein n=1 Tax=Lactuca saligna TaxID=75948 RepID=A0AA35ZZL5_LACSI|nr:unnamed protein product [Lactuca saligna]
MNGDERNRKEVKSDASYEEIRGNDSSKNPRHEEGQSRNSHEKIEEQNFVPNNRCAGQKKQPDSRSDPLCCLDYVFRPTVSNPERKANHTNAPIGFSGGFGRVSGVVDSEDELTHPPGFSNCNSFVVCSDDSYNKGSFLSEIQKTMEMGKAMGYDLEGCYDLVKEIVKGNG